jgi:HSP20 family protein
MAQVAIQKCKNSEAVAQTLLDRMEAVTDSIRTRAFNLFQHRLFEHGNAANGSDLDDWLQAERDMVLSPASELVDDVKEFRARIAMPGFEPGDIKVSALPDALVIQADATHTHEGKSGSVRFCEFSGKKLFRQLGLPESVDVDRVTASLDKGILEVTAPKAAAPQKKAEPLRKVAAGN